MKTKSLLFFIFLAVFSASAYAQNVEITSKKTTYKRPKPMIDFKKTFTVNRPLVKASTPALSKKIETAISYEKVLGFNLKEELNEIQWLEEADYEVKYNKNGILNVFVSMSGTGAYPSTTTESVVVNTKTGLVVKPADVFTNPQGLAKLVKKYQKDAIKAGIEAIKKEPDFDEPNPETLFESADFTIENLQKFSIDDNGITFIYSYGFPHAIQALEPNGNYEISWKQLKPFIKPSGLFGQFVK